MDLDFELATLVEVRFYADFGQPKSIGDLLVIAGIKPYPTKG